MTKAYNKFFINGEWVEPSGRPTLDVINPATEEAFATISMGTADDVDAAAKASSVGHQLVASRSDFGKSTTIMAASCGPLSVSVKHAVIRSRSPQMNVW